ncbi:MAG: hypothetical protein ABL959_19340, partial [Pyrinomonadaceae bacterium]
VTISTTTSSLAFETDQYNLPPVPLGDIGAEVSGYFEENLIAAIGEVNDEIDRLSECTGENEKRVQACPSASDARHQLNEALGDDAVGRALFKRIGDGSLFITKTGKWFRSHQFAVSPASHKVPYSESIYFFKPSNQLTLSPTIRMFDIEFGTDKIEHLLQQGWKYYEIRGAELDKGKTPVEAAKKAVEWGKRSERTYYGLMSSGVYSNADLVANYVGMRFYEGMTKPLQINGSTRPAILEIHEGRWRIAPNVDLKASLLKPFISEHLNEAFNPSGYAFYVYPTVKRVVRTRACPGWQSLIKQTTKADLTERSALLEKWISPTAASLKTPPPP